MILPIHDPLDFQSLDSLWMYMKKFSGVLFVDQFWGQLASLRYTKFMDFESFNTWNWYSPHYLGLP